MKQRRPNRHGYTLIAVLVLLSFLMALLGLMVRQSVRDRREIRKELQRNQSLLFCDAGIQLARLRLKKDQSYGGEEWSPETPELSGRKAVVKIEVSYVSAENVMIRSTVTYQSTNNESDRIVRTVSIELPSANFPTRKEPTSE
jgi:type II secretory pathway pseudopilin PulG